jgi:hypothetical protein
MVSQSTATSVFFQRDRQRGRLELRFELLELLALSARFAVNRILKSLHELLQMSHPALQRGQLLCPGGRSLACRRRVAGGVLATHPCDPLDQGVVLKHQVPP